MKIFITGIAGFLGGQVAKRMIEVGHQVVGVDNLSGGFVRNIPQEAEFYQENCINVERMVELMKGCELVFHAACVAHEGVSVFSPFHITKNTYQITMSILSAAIQNEVKRFIYCSSMARYGKQASMPYREDMICEPNDPYAIAKYASEMTLKKLAELNQLEYVIAVPHNIYGPGQNFIDPYRNVIAIMINRMLRGERPIVYGTGEQCRCFSYIDDVTEAFEKMLLMEGISGEIINIGPDDEFITINQLVNLLNELLHTSYEPIYVPQRPMEVKSAYCSSQKMKELLHVEAKTSLRDGIVQLIRYIKEYGPAPFNYDYLNIEIKNRMTPETWTKRLI